VRLLSENVLNLIGGQESAQIAVGHLWLWQAEVNLGGRLALVRAVDLVELLEGRLGPDAEATQVTTWSDLEQIQTRDVEEGDTWNVSECASETLVLVVDDKWASLHDASAVTHLTLTGTESLGGIDLLNVLPGLELLEKLDGLLGALDLLDLVAQDQWDLGGLFDLVALGQDEAGNAGGSDGADEGIASLLDVHLAVPSSPGLGGREHATAAAHVAKGTLAASVSTATANAGNTGNGAAGTPGLGARLHTGFLAHGEGLTRVLAHLVVHEVDDVRANGRLEDGGEKDLGLGGLALLIVDGDVWSRCS